MLFLTFAFAPFFFHPFDIKLLSNGVAPILTHLNVKKNGQKGFHSSAQQWTLGTPSLLRKQVSDMFVVYCFYYEVDKISNT